MPAWQRRRRGPGRAGSVLRGFCAVSASRSMFVRTLQSLPFSFRVPPWLTVNVRASSPVSVPGLTAPSLTTPDIPIECSRRFREAGWVGCALTAKMLINDLLWLCSIMRLLTTVSEFSVTFFAPSAKSVIWPTTFPLLSRTAPPLPTI
jgi:hypothetical protein